MQPDRSTYVQTVVVLVVATLTYCLSEYHTPFAEAAWNNALFYLVIPLLTILLLRQNPLRWGLGLGNLKWTVGVILVGAIGVGFTLFLFSQSPAMRNYYRPLRPTPAQFWRWLGLVAVELFAWEYLWRSFMLFGLEPGLGEFAVYVQMVPFAIAHLRKPEIETLSSIVGGILLGYLIYKCRSFWPAFLLHLALYAGVHFI